MHAADISGITPPEGYETVKDGGIEDGDLIWDRMDNRWARIFGHRRVLIGSTVDEDSIVARASSKMVGAKRAGGNESKGYFHGNVYYCDTVNSYRCYYEDGEPVDFSHPRPCPKCGGSVGGDGCDPCIGKLPGVKFACCGHGIHEGYILFENDVRVSLSKYVSIDRSHFEEVPADHDGTGTGPNQYKVLYKIGEPA